MFDPILNFLNSLWDLFLFFIYSVLEWVLEVIMSCFGMVLTLIKYMLWQGLDFAIGLFSPFLVSLFDTFPTFTLWTSNILVYLSTINQLFPVTEFFVCLLFVFTFWLSTWCVKVIKKFIPTEA